MITPVSAATPASAMNPTATATDMLKPIHHSSHTPPTKANGSDSITMSVSVSRRKFRKRSRKTTSSVSGTTIRSRASARSRYSYCPLHWSVVPWGSVTSSATALRASAT